MSISEHLGEVGASRSISEPSYSAVRVLDAEGNLVRTISQAALMARDRRRTREECQPSLRREATSTAYPLVAARGRRKPRKVVRRQVAA